MVFPNSENTYYMLEDDDPHANYRDMYEYHCKDCKYSRWYKEGKKYGCPEGGMRRICGSFCKYDDKE